MSWYSKPHGMVIEELETDSGSGLTSEQAEKKLVEHGQNKLREKVPKTFFQRFLAQLTDVMVIILIIAAAISIGLNFYNLSVGNETEWAEPIVILMIVLLNAFLGVIQESKAEAALEALKKLSAPIALVIRDGKEDRLPSENIVPGDIVKLEAGDWVPADCRIISSANLQSDEASLTGESVPSKKGASDEVLDGVPLGDRSNMVYSGCFITYGHGIVVVTETGMGTEMGKIADMLEQEEEGDTPLQKKLAQLGKMLGFLALGICAIIFAVGLIDKLPPLEMFMTAISLAVAAIPEGLPAIVTIVLAIGVQRMVKKHAIIRRLPAVETLGSASVICSDKTGTLTQNRMTLVKVYDGENIVSLEDAPTEKVSALIKLASLCTDGTVTIEDGKEKHIGDPTETAIVACALKFGMPKDALSEEMPRIGEVPFDSDRKMMTTVHKMGVKTLVIVKGAPDILLTRCVTGDKDSAAKANIQMGHEALRVLAVAYKYIDTLPEELTSGNMENGLTFLGLVGMIDPPRPEVKLAIEECKKAGIRTVMITGDHVATASAIAKQLGIMEDDSQGISGLELAELSDEDLVANIRHYCVYARVTPSDKIRIVKAWQSIGETVAMTGDGVNDAPSLKAADIGCAMGITGTDVAKGAADMTLTDDNFATIVTAVKEGRGIFDNIRKAVHFLLSCNLGEILTVFVAMMLWRESPLMPMQLLWINLVTDSLPALALGVEPVEFDVMERKPRTKEESMFAHGRGYAAAAQGILIGTLTLIAYFIGTRVFTLAGGEVNIPLGETMAFATLAISQLVHAFNIRSSHSMFKVGLSSNKYMIGAFFVSLLMMLVVLIIPFMQTIFQVTSMNWVCWLIVAGLTLVPFVAVEAGKAISNLFAKKKAH